MEIVGYKRLKDDMRKVDHAVYARNSKTITLIATRSNDNSRISEDNSDHK